MEPFELARQMYSELLENSATDARGLVSLGYIGVVSSRLEQKSSTRQVILHAAALEFRAKGFDGATFAGIAARMGRPRSAIGYHQFRSKEAIAAALVEQQSVRWDALIRSAESMGPGISRLLSVLLTAALDAHSNPEAAAALRLILESRDNPELNLPALQVRWRDYALAEMVGASASESLPAGVRPEEFVELLLNSSLGVFEAEHRGLQAINTSQTLLGLWARLLTGFEIPEAERILSAVCQLE